MNRFFYLIVIGLAVLLNACGPVPSDTTVPSVTEPITITGSVSTASVSTVEPVFITDLPPDFTPPPTPVPLTRTPIPTLPGGLGPTELKYRVLDQVPDLFFCDPDFYPVAREDEADLARQRFPELQANTEEFEAILAHNNLSGFSTFSDDQKLLIYREHKKLAAIQFELADSGYRFQLQVAKTEGEGEIVTGLIDNQGTITVQQRNPSFATCPICLAADTLIDTPSGHIRVQNIGVGTQVWTVDRAGKRAARPVILLGKTVVPAAHQVIYIILEDGRELRASPGHPTTGGRRLGVLKVGDSLDGAFIRSAERVRYGGSATYDLLPAGETGFYWANGILIASTLKGEH